MICPKCGNTITIEEFSCTRCGLRLPVKNREERMRAEALAEQIYAQQRVERMRAAQQVPTQVQSVQRTSAQMWATQQVPPQVKSVQRTSVQMRTTQQPAAEVWPIQQSSSQVLPQAANAQVQSRQGLKDRARQMAQRAAERTQQATAAATPESVKSSAAKASGTVLGVFSSATDAVRNGKLPFLHNKQKDVSGTVAPGTVTPVNAQHTPMYEDDVYRGPVKMPDGQNYSGKRQGSKKTIAAIASASALFLIVAVTASAILAGSANERRLTAGVADARKAMSDALNSDAAPGDDGVLSDGESPENDNTYDQDQNVLEITHDNEAGPEAGLSAEYEPQDINEYNYDPSTTDTGTAEELIDVSEAGDTAVQEVPEPELTEPAEHSQPGESLPEEEYISVEGLDPQHFQGTDAQDVVTKDVTPVQEQQTDVVYSDNNTGVTGSDVSADSELKVSGTKDITRQKDGQKVTITIPESESEDARFVLNISTGAYHVRHGGCRAERAMDEINRIYTNASSETIKSWNYLPCGTCKPGNKLSVTQTAMQKTIPSEQTGYSHVAEAPVEVTAPKALDTASYEPEPVIENTTPSNESQQQEQMVWLSKTGGSYHNRNDCGNMNPEKAVHVTLSEAISKNKTRCSKCKW